MKKFIQPQIPIEVDRPPVGKNWIHEIKFDGIRLQVHVENKKVKLFDLQGRDRTSEFPTLCENILEMKLKSAIFDAEAVILDRQGKTQFKHLERAMHFKDDTQIKLFFFDLLFINNEDIRHLPIVERKAILEKIIPTIHPRLRFSDHVHKDPESFFNINCQLQLEGIISKVSTAPYTSGKNTYWCQTKCSKTDYFFIAGFNEETEELILGKFERDQYRFVGQVFADDKFVRIKKRLLKIPLEKSVFEKFPKTNTKKIHWVKPEIKAEIIFSNWTDEKQLRNPVLLELVT